MRILLFCVVLLAGSASAQDWAFRNGDEILDREALDELVSGSALTFYDDGTSRFSAGGAYSYTYAGGATAFGAFTIADAGQICIRFRNGFGRCDTYVRNAGRLILLTEKAQRFPVRDISMP
jgi:hypothetical protein